MIDVDKPPTIPPPPPPHCPPSFPNLAAGYIAYKAVQQATGMVAVGPLLPGLVHPVPDLSRGATVADIVATAAVTGVQAGAARGARAGAAAA